MELQNYMYFFHLICEAALTIIGCGDYQVKPPGKFYRNDKTLTKIRKVRKQQQIHSILVILSHFEPWIVPGMGCSIAKENVLLKSFYIEDSKGITYIHCMILVVISILVWVWQNVFNIVHLELLHFFLQLFQ